MNGRKPTNLKVVARNEIMTNPGDLPELPSSIPDEMQHQWDVAVKSLSARGLLADDVMPMVETYVMALWMQQESLNVIRKEGMTFMVKKTGEIKKHPATSELKAARDDAIRIAVELGLTPSAKSRRGMGGEPSEPSGEQDNDDGSPSGLAI